MGVIHLLRPEVAEGIAAGEVIERPASVIKELVENSLDAGAQEICVVLEEGGRKGIVVEDDGCGMVAEDLKLSVARHATSKISTLEDLDALSSMGFRGEALASIAAVTDLSILSRTAASADAFLMKPVIGISKVTHGHFLGSHHGTRIEARDLFAQMPARLKFLKSARSEVGYVREMIERLALTSPATGFKLVSDDRTILDLRPGSEVERVRKILSAHAEHGHLETFIHGDLRIYWLRGSSVGTLKHCYQVVNRRAVRDRMIQQSLLSAFRQSLLPGQFPALALFLDVDPATLDVNSHPTKTEVRFSDPGYVFQWIKGGAEEVIGHQGHGAFGGVALERPTSAEFQFDRLTSTPGETRNTESTEGAEQEDSPELHSVPTHPLARAPFVATLFRTYLVFDLGSKVALVDQHAADERVRFEKFRREMTSGKLESQGLLLPETMTLTQDAREVLPQWQERLAALGFDVDLLGQSQAVVRAIPALWGNYALPERISNLFARLNNLAANEHPAWDELLFETAAMRACRSAIKAGDVLSAWAAHELVGQMLACEHPWNCPHGRPTTVEIDQSKFEEWFLRTAPS